MGKPVMTDVQLPLPVITAISPPWNAGSRAMAAVVFVSVTVPTLTGEEVTLLEGVELIAGTLETVTLMVASV